MTIKIRLLSEKLLEHLHMSLCRDFLSRNYKTYFIVNSDSLFNINLAHYCKL